VIHFSDFIFIICKISEIFRRRISAKTFLDISRRTARFRFIFTAGDARHHGNRSRRKIFIRTNRIVRLDIICRNFGNRLRRFAFDRISHTGHRRFAFFRRIDFGNFLIFRFLPNLYLRNHLIRHRCSFRSRSVFARRLGFRSARDFYSEKLTFS
jgi:hypothetical protein